MAGRPTETLHRWVPRLTLSKFTWNRLVPPLKTEAPAWRPSAVAGRQTHASLGSGWEELWVPAVTSREPLPHLGAAHPGPGRVWRRADWLGALWAPTCGVGPTASVLTHSGPAHSACVGCDVTKLDYFKGTALDVGGCQRLVPYLCSPNSLCASPGSNQCRRPRVARGETCAEVAMLPPGRCGGAAAALHARPAPRGA